jgi:hypothetical protein
MGPASFQWNRQIFKLGGPKDIQVKSDFDNSYSLGQYSLQ